MTNRQAMGRASKHRGNGYENEVAKQLTSWSGAEFHRTPGSGSLGWASENHVEADVIAPPSLDFNYIVECKRYADWTLWNLLKGNSYFPAFWAQAVREGASAGKVPLLVYRRNNERSLVTMPYNTKVLKQYDPIIVKTITYTSEVDNEEESCQTMTVLLDNLMENDFNKFNALYEGQDWQKQIKRKPKKKVKEPTVKDAVNLLDQLGI